MIVLNFWSSRKNHVDKVPTWCKDFAFHIGNHVDICRMPAWVRKTLFCYGKAIAQVFNLICQPASVFIFSLCYHMTFCKRYFHNIITFPWTLIWKGYYLSIFSSWHFYYAVIVLEFDDNLDQQAKEMLMSPTRNGIWLANWKHSIYLRIISWWFIMQLEN